jgi:FeS assembly SUF system protein
MIRMDKKDAMENAATHHTIDAPRVGETQADSPSASKPEAAPSSRSDVPVGSAAKVNPGFDMRQPQELGPRNVAAPALDGEEAEGLVSADAASGDGDTEMVGATGSVNTAAAPSVAEGGTVVAGSALSREELEQMTDNIIAALKTVYDPEIPADIYELGLIYKIDIKDNREVEVDMTLTAPGCPVAGEMPQWVENAVRSVAGVGDVSVNLVFDPPWDMSRMSDEARLAINMF